MAQQDNRLRRIYEEVLALSKEFKYIDWDDEDGCWVLIHQIPLPPQYHQKKQFTACLIELPANYPNLPPTATYVDPDLDINNEHYRDQRHREKGYKWLCAHPQTWNPATPWQHGDTLFTIVASVRLQLNLLKPARR